MLMATTMGTPAARACEIASTVWGRTPSSAATITTAMSVTLAPRARMAEKACGRGGGGGLRQRVEARRVEACGRRGRQRACRGRPATRAHGCMCTQPPALAAGRRPTLPCLHPLTPTTTSTPTTSRPAGPTRCPRPPHPPPPHTHLMAGRVQEGDLPRLSHVVDVAGIGADGLRDAARLARRHLGLADEVEQGGLRGGGGGGWGVCEWWLTGSTACACGAARRACASGRPRQPPPAPQRPPAGSRRRHCRALAGPHPAAARCGQARAPPPRLPRTLP